MARGPRLAVVRIAGREHYQTGRLCRSRRQLGEREDDKRMLTQESLGTSDQFARGVAETRTRLVTEFQERLQPDIIQRVVDDVLRTLQDASVRDFVPLFVYRAARDELTDMAHDGAAR
jgi:hypothetical protein